jgi:hypothetical protein
LKAVCSVSFRTVKTLSFDVVTVPAFFVATINFPSLVATVPAIVRWP